MSKTTLIWFAWITIAVIAIWLRGQSLTTRPIHADEATGARITAQRLDSSDYSFDPTHFHGPWLSLSGSLTAQFNAESSWTQLSLFSLRSGTACAGVLLALTPLLWRRFLGDPAALAAGALLATSPLLVYYSQMYIHETWLALFGMLALPMVHRYSIAPSIRNGLLAGLFIGLMFATKETFAISILAWLPATIASVAALRICSADAHQVRSFSRYRNAFLAMTVTALAVSTILYTDFFRTPSGIVDAFKTYFVYETTPGHDKAWNYYAELLLWPKNVLGIWWTEGLVTILLLAGIFLAACSPKTLPAALLISLGALAHCLIYTVISYKNPWLMLLPWSIICLGGSLAFASWRERAPTAKVLLALTLLLTLGFQTKQSLHATGRYADDERNPYSYVPTTKDPRRMLAWIEEIEALPTTPTLAPAAVVGTGYWPLPWYLRSLDPVGYWPAPEESMQLFPLVFAMPGQQTACDQLLETSHTAFPRSLRSNVAVTLYLRNDIWDAWSTTPTK